MQFYLAFQTSNKLIMWLVSVSTAKHTLSSLLKVDPAYRISANQLLEVSWITVSHWFLPAAFISFTNWVIWRALMGCFVQQGKTNESAQLPNVLDMMRDHLENRDSNDKDEFKSSQSWFEHFNERNDASDNIWKQCFDILDSNISKHLFIYYEKILFYLCSNYLNNIRTVQ